jgi:hypothetical protein
MKAHGLDGWVRTVPAGQARPSSVLGGMPQYHFSSIQHKRLTRAVFDWSSIDGHSTSAVEGEGFRQLMRLADPRFVPPSRTYMQQVCAFPVTPCIS